MSRRKGAIYVGLRRSSSANLPATKVGPGDGIGQTSLAYEDVVTARRRTGQAAFAIVDRSAAGLGLTRGELLVDQAGRPPSTMNKRRPPQTRTAVNERPRKPY